MDEHVGGAQHWHTVAGAQDAHALLHRALRQHRYRKPCDYGGAQAADTVAHGGDAPGPISSSASSAMLREIEPIGSSASGSASND